MLRVNYDKKFDVLYLVFADNSNSIGDEDDYGIVTHKDRNTNEITSITIFGFQQKLQAGSHQQTPTNVSHIQPIQKEQVLSV